MKWYSPVPKRPAEGSTVLASEVNSFVNDVIKNNAINPNNPKLVPPSKVLAQIAALDKETVQDSVNNFFHDDMFLFPGIPPEQWRIRSDFPLHPSVGSVEMGRIMSNRRFLKLCEDLGKLPKLEAARLINAQLESLLAAYNPLYEAKANEILKTKNIDFALDTSATPRPTITGCRQAILGLVWVAGNLQLVDSHAAVLKVADLAVKQRDHWYGLAASAALDRQGTQKKYSRAIIAYTSLYHRQILATGLLGTSGRVTDPEKFLKDHKVSYVTNNLTKYNSKVTVFDTFLGGYHFPVDYSKGTLPIRCASDMDDKTFDAIKADVLLK